MDESTPHTSSPSSKERLAEFNSRIAAQQLFPLWDRLGDLLPAEPMVRSKPWLWRYEEVRPMLLEAGRIIEERDAERRVLILENPGLEGESSVCESLFSGLQVLMPGESAPAHRHTPSALRFILESASAYTTVDDEIVNMEPGDLILTPSWTWHGHRNDGDAPVIWLDVLDLPAVRAMGPRFAERRREVDAGHGGRNLSMLRYGMNMAPVADAVPEGGSPLRYSYVQCRQVLSRLLRTGDLHPSHGVKMEYISPQSGAAVLPGISAYLQMLPAGFVGRPDRSTEGAVYCVVEGAGSVLIDAPDGRQEFEFRPFDIFVVPCWHAYTYVATDETILVSAGNRAAQEHFGLWRGA